MKPQLAPGQPKPPVLPTPELSVGGISSLGIVGIAFSSPMEVPKEYRKRSRILSQVEEEEHRRFLGKVEDAVHVQMIGNQNLNYTWNISNFTPNKMEVQFYFDNAAQVSADGKADVLLVTIKDPSMFQGTNGYTPSSFVIVAELPKQIQLGGTDEAVVGAAGEASASSQGVVIGNFILSLMLSASLNQMWSMVEAQQIIVMFPMFFIAIPPVPAFFIAKFMEIANFDVLPVGDVWGKIFYMPPCLQLGARYNAVGMDDTMFVGNIGSLFVTIIIVQFMMIAAIAAFNLKDCIKNKRFKKGAKNIWLKLKNDAFWIVPIQTLMEASMVISLASFLLLQEPNWESTGQKVDTTIGYVLGAIIILFTIWCTAFMIYHREDVTDELHHSYGPLWEDLDTNNHWIPFYRFAFLFRRILLSAAIVLCKNLCFQIFGAYFQSVLMIITIGLIQPFEDKSRNNKEMINEVVILFSIYFVMCFSDLVSADSAMTTVGYAFCLMLACHIVINISIIIVSSVKDAIMKFKKWRFLREHLKAAKLALLLLDRKKIRQNARERVETCRKGHEEQLDKDLEEIGKLQQGSIENNKREKKGSKKEKLKRLATITEEREDEEITDTTSKKRDNNWGEEESEEIIDTTSHQLQLQEEDNDEIIDTT